MYNWKFRAKEEPPILQQTASIEQTEDGGYIVDSTWLSENLYRCKLYYDLGEEKWKVFLINVEDSENCSFERLKTIFMNTPYSNVNSYKLEDGVNCQGMVCYISDWCSKNNCPYSIEYSSYHVDIIVNHKGTWYKFDFTKSPTITEVEGDYFNGST